VDAVITNLLIGAPIAIALVILAHWGDRLIARRRARLDIRAAHRRDASLTARLTSPALARCDQASDIAAGLERRRAMPLPAPVEDDLVDDDVRIGPRASHTVRVRVVECAPDETPTTRGGAA
jgi:hypothetical protein